MIQQQVVDYAKDQLKLGVSRDMIKSALLGAGWAGADIDDSLKSLDSSPAPKVEEKKPPVSSTPTIILSDLMANSKIKPISVGKIASVANKIEPKIETLQSYDLKKSGVSNPGKIILITVLAVVALLAAGLAAYLYLQNIELQKKISNFSIQIDAANSKTSNLASQVADLTSQKVNLDSQIESWKDRTLRLVSELSFFATPLNVTSTADLAFILKGTLAGGGKTLYTVTSDDGVKVSVKNSKDEKIDAVLKDLAGSMVEITGTHAAISRDVTVTGVNGTPVQ